MIHEIKIDIFKGFKDSQLGDDLFADNVNKIFPIDTGKNALESLAFILKDDDAKKIYNSDERLFMLTRILEASKKFDDNFINQIKEMEGGFSVGNVYTEAELNAKAEELAEKKAEELANKKAEEMNKEYINNLTQEEKDKALAEANDSLKAELENTRKEKEEAEKKAIALEKEKQEAEDEKARQEVASKRVNDLSESGIKFSKNEDVIAMIKNLDDNSFANFKVILEDVIDSNKEDSGDGEPDGKQNLAEGSEHIPNAPEGEEETALDKILKEQINRGRISK